MSDKYKSERMWTKSWFPSPGCRYTVDISLSEECVQHFRNLNRAIGEAGNWPGGYFSDYFSFWIWKGGDSKITEISGILRDQYMDLFKRTPELDREYANFIKKFISAFDYRHDDRSIGHMEYGKFPIEMLYDLEGDCEDLSMLLASLYVRAGFKTAILLGYTKPGLRGYHAATGIAIPRENGDDSVSYNGTDFVYCEAVSSDRVGHCAFPFPLFREHASIHCIEPDYIWKGSPPAWSCDCGRDGIEPWSVHCPTCGSNALFTAAQVTGDRAIDWDSTVVVFLKWLEWVGCASHLELTNEIVRLSRAAVWDDIPSGNRNYLMKVVSPVVSGRPENAAPYLEGARHHLASAWPHVAAAVFSHSPHKGSGGENLHSTMFGIGDSVSGMDNATLAQFTRKILSDTTCKRIKGFSGGSRLALGRILHKYETEGDAYLNKKRQSIERLLVKVVLPQTFTLLAREFKGSV